MQYFVVKNRQTKKNVAVIFHDYVTKHYIVQSLSEAFRKSFEASIKSLGGYSFTAVDKKLVSTRLTLENPAWAKEVLKKACGSNWSFLKKGEFSYQLDVNDIIAKYLK